MDKIKVGVVGATGYAGSEICRLILGHPQAELAAISSVSFEGMALSQVYPAYYQLCDMVCGTQEEVVEKSDVIFAALPHGLSQELGAQCYALGKTFIDMGADFRLESEEDYKEWYGGEYQDKALHKEAVYGLPEFFREKIKGKKLIANPGCYTTAVPLALVPALEAGYIEPQGIIADCKSGVTGAGRKPTQGNHYPELNESFTAYKVANHRHTPEIEQILGKPGEVVFTPHLVPQKRGLLSTVYLQLTDEAADMSVEDMLECYHALYDGRPFVQVLPAGKLPRTASVVGTNVCQVGLAKNERTHTLVAIGAIDNLCKGAAGQGVQCANLVFGLDEKTGLSNVGMPV